jgi:hypothetical protein
MSSTQRRRKNGQFAHGPVAAPASPSVPAGAYGRYQQAKAARPEVRVEVTIEHNPGGFEGRNWENELVRTLRKYQVDVKSFAEQTNGSRWLGSGGGLAWTRLGAVALAKREARRLREQFRRAQVKFEL